MIIMLCVNLADTVILDALAFTTSQAKLNLAILI